MCHCLLSDLYLYNLSEINSELTEEESDTAVESSHYNPVEKCTLEMMYCILLNLLSHHPTCINVGDIQSVLLIPQHTHPHLHYSVT